MLKHAAGTSGRGSGTGAGRGPSARTLAWALSFSVALHLVLTPVAAWLGVFAWLFNVTSVEDLSEPEQLRSIPITWLGEEAEPEPESASPAPALTAPVALTETPSATPVPSVPPAAPAPPSPAEEKPEKPPEAKPATGRPDIKHPVALAGVQTDLVDSNANVNLLLFSDRVREHPLGARIGKLLTDFPQWSSFFETAELDPIRDLNRILIVGPEFRRSADVVAIVQHRLGREVLRKALDRLVRRPPRGRWLNSKVPAARAHADRAERLFVLPTSNLLVVAPLHLEKQLLAAPPLRFPAPDGKQALVLHVRSPVRALRGLPLALPESILWLRLDVTALEDGGAQLRMTAEDDAALARTHAQGLSAAINALTHPDLGALGALLGLRSIALIDRLELRAQGNRISGQVELSRAQLERLLGLAEELLTDWNDRSAPAQRTAPSPAVPSSGARRTGPNGAHAVPASPTAPP
jgi:hypothetical protein